MKLRELILHEIKLCEKQIHRAETEKDCQQAKIDCYNDHKLTLTDLLIQYDKEHPGEKEGENNATD